ncbi:MAG: hypothetical protein WAQ08_05855 [Aquabacterium sp.]|uniref:hypothetical protein n=1 Tax=Aquabacterium sp. TaxID=1872578 RepID=UPI003BB02879
MIEAHAIPQHRVAQALAGLASLDPRGILTDEGVASIGKGEGQQCLRVVRWDGYSVAGKAVMVIGAENGVAWVDAAAGEGAGMSEAIHQVASAWARQHGCKEIGFLTARRGLVAKLKPAGYAVTGWVMKAKVQ